MKTLFSLVGSLLICGTVVAADSDARSDVKAAAKKLADKGSYSWTSTPKVEGGGGGGGGNFRPGPTEGQTAEGTIHLKLTFGERDVEASRRAKKSPSRARTGGNPRVSWKAIAHSWPADSRVTRPPPKKRRILLIKPSR